MSHTQNNMVILRILCTCPIKIFSTLANIQFLLFFVLFLFVFCFLLSSLFLSCCLSIFVACAIRKENKRRHTKKNKKLYYFWSYRLLGLTQAIQQLSTSFIHATYKLSIARFGCAKYRERTEEKKTPHIRWSHHIIVQLQALYTLLLT